MRRGRPETWDEYRRQYRLWEMYGRRGPVPLRPERPVTWKDSANSVLNPRRKIDYRTAEEVDFVDVLCKQNCTHVGAEKMERSFSEGLVYTVDDSLGEELLAFGEEYFVVAEDASGGGLPVATAPTVEEAPAEAEAPAEEPTEEDADGSDSPSGTSSRRSRSG